MIISHRHKFIFLHCRKAAGSSITVSLARYLGNSDIVLGAIHDCVKHGVRPPRRMVIEAFRHPHAGAIYKKLLVGSLWKFVSVSNKSYYSNILGKAPQHAPAAQVKAVFPSEWSAYTKFCVVRNPWSKTLSDYFWSIRGIQGPPGFSDYVRALESGKALEDIVPLHNSNWDMCAIDDRICIDSTVRFENLEADLLEVTNKIGINWDGWLPRAKLNSTKKERSYQDFYDAETKDIVSRIYEKEINHFNYNFDP